MLLEPGTDAGCKTGAEASVVVVQLGNEPGQRCKGSSLERLMQVVRDIPYTRHRRRGTIRDEAEHSLSRIILKGGNLEVGQPALLYLFWVVE